MKDQVCTVYKHKVKVDRKVSPRLAITNLLQLPRTCFAVLVKYIFLILGIKTTLYWLLSQCCVGGMYCRGAVVFILSKLSLCYTNTVISRPQCLVSDAPHCLTTSQCNLTISFSFLGQSISKLVLVYINILIKQNIQTQ